MFNVTPPRLSCSSDLDYFSRECLNTRRIVGSQSINCIVSNRESFLGGRKITPKRKACDRCRLPKRKGCSRKGCIDQYCQDTQDARSDTGDADVELAMGSAPVGSEGFNPLGYVFNLALDRLPA